MPKAEADLVVRAKLKPAATEPGGISRPAVTRLADSWLPVDAIVIKKECGSCFSGRSTCPSLPTPDHGILFLSQWDLRPPGSPSSTSLLTAPPAGCTALWAPASMTGFMAAWRWDGRPQGGWHLATWLSSTLHHPT